MEDNPKSDYNARANDMNRISAGKTDFLDEEPDTNDSDMLSAEVELSHSEGFDTINDEHEAVYQDDLNYSNDAVDPFTNEATDDPTEELQVPPEEFKKEMDNLALGDQEDDDEENLR